MASTLSKGEAVRLLTLLVLSMQLIGEELIVGSRRLGTREKERPKILPIICGVIIIK